MGILDMLDEVSSKVKIIENHPVSGETLENMVLYLQGLALVANVDNNIHKNEEQYLELLIKSFKIDSSILESVIDFSKNPSQDVVLEFIEVFKNLDKKQNFLFDSLCISSKNGPCTESQLLAIKKLSGSLLITHESYDSIHQLKNSTDAKDSKNFNQNLSSSSLEKKQFIYLADFLSLKLDDFNSDNDSSGNEVSDDIEEAVTPPERVIKSLKSILLSNEKKLNYESSMCSGKSLNDNSVTKKIKNAFDSYAYGSGEDELLLLVDTTVFGNGKKGIYVTENNLYLNEVEYRGRDGTEWGKISVNIREITNVRVRRDDNELSIQGGIDKTSRGVKFSFVSYLDRHMKTLVSCLDEYNNQFNDSTE